MNVKSKPISYTAHQYDGTVEGAIACGLKENPISGRRYVDETESMQRSWVEKGDWVLKDDVGHIKVVSDKLFKRAYEEVV